MDAASASNGPQLQPPPVIPDRTARLTATLQAIETMDLDAMRTMWAKHFGTPPNLRSLDLMRLVLSWRLQARTYGGIDAAMKRKLRRKTAIEAGKIELAAGTTLTREWQGQTYEIEVIEDGFRWEGQTYPSLSAVASAITGSRWSGPKFFNLKGTKP